MNGLILTLKNRTPGITVFCPLPWNTKFKTLATFLDSGFLPVKAEINSFLNHFLTRWLPVSPFWALGQHLSLLGAVILIEVLGRLIISAQGLQFRSIGFSCLLVMPIFNDLRQFLKGEKLLGSFPWISFLYLPLWWHFYTFWKQKLPLWEGEASTVLLSWCWLVTQLHTIWAGAKAVVCLGVCASGQGFWSFLLSNASSFWPCPLAASLPPLREQFTP